MSVGGTSLHYEIDGSGPPIVLLHGFALDRRIWDGQVPALIEHHTVVRYDLRGFGRSSPSPEPYRHAADLQTLVDRLGFERVSLMGLSLGGGTAINFTIANPDRVDRLIVVAPSLSGFAWSAAFVAEQAAIRHAAREGGVAAARDQWLALPNFAPALANPVVSAALRDMVEGYSGWHWMHPDTAIPTNPPAIHRLAEIRTRTLVFVGDRDSADFQAIASTLACAIPHAQRIVLEGAGHIANMEARETFNAVVVPFLAGANSDTSFTTV